MSLLTRAEEALKSHFEAAAGVGAPQRLQAAMAHAVHGAIGFTHEHALQQGTRRLWAWRSEFGNLGHWAQRLGRAVSQGGATSLWPAVTAGHLAALSPSPVETP